MASKTTEDEIRNYLDGLAASDRPIVDKEAVRVLRAQIREEQDSINRLKLLAQLEQEEQGHTPDRSGNEAVFVAEAKAWAEAEGVPASAFQAMGVSDDVLKQAGFEIAAGSSLRTRRRRSTSGGSREPRLPLEDVESAAKGLSGQWKLNDLAGKINRDPATTRNYLKKLMESGVVKEVGDDPSHDGRGRAPKLYSS